MRPVTLNTIIDPKTGIEYEPVRKSYSAERQKNYREGQKWKGRVCANWWVDRDLCHEFLWEARQAGLDNQMDAINYILASALSQWKKERYQFIDEVEATGLSDTLLDAHEIFHRALRQAFSLWTKEKRSQRTER